MVDQNGAVVSGANVSVVNTATGATREGFSGDEGTATISGLPLTGEYKVSVAMLGFKTEEATSLTLRAGETATVKVRLLASGGKSEVTVFGTTEGVRADPQIGLALESDHINETPILGRKVSTLPLLNSAFRQGKGTGDLFVMAHFDVTEFSNGGYQTLSGGERQRVNFARVLTQLWIDGPSRANSSCRYLFLDEPLTFLDIRHQIDFMKKIKELAAAVEIVTVGVVHDLNLAARFADHIVLLNETRIVASGNPIEVLTRERIHDVLGVEPTFVQSGDSHVHFIFN